MKVWVILYTYSGYDGEIDRLWADNVTEEYLVFASEELATQYFVNHRLNKQELARSLKGKNHVLSN